MPSIDHFGIFAPHYDRIIQLRDPRQMIEKTLLPTSGSLLDAGGGTGRVSQAFTEMASQVVVADLSLRMLRQAAEKPGLRLVNTHTERLPFADGTFERVIMVDTLHHVCDQAETADELWRVLKPGGRLVIEEPDLRTFIVKVVAVLEKVALMRSHFLSPPRIATLFNSKGAQVSIEREGFNSWVLVDKPNTTMPGG